MNATVEDIDASRAPLLSHLMELRRRILRCLIAFVALFAVAYAGADYVYAFLTRPLVQVFGEEHGRRMIYTGLHEAFFTYLKLAAFTAAFVCIPLVLNQVWKFIAPGLYTHERRSLRPAFLATPVLFVAGASLAFYVVFPLAWRFFLSFEHAGVAGGMPVELEARVGEYLGLVMQLILAFGLSFELPVLLLVLARVGMVTARSLREHRKHAIVLTFLLAAIITPPDLISQALLGTPIVLLYELSIRLVEWTDADAERRRRDALRQSNAA